MEENARSEKEILDDILSKIESLHDIGQVLPKSYFTQVEQDERVQITNEDLVLDDCTSTIFQGQALPTQGAFLQVSRTASSNYARTIPDSPSQPNTFKRCPPKPHRRILYGEYGEALNSPEVLTDHKRMFKSLSQAAMGLKLLYRSGYVHRDLSLGNLFSCEDGNCKISNSECTKPYELPPNSRDRVVDEDDQDVKVGTPAFMAVELQLHLKNHPQESNPPSPNPGHSLTGKVA